MKSNRMSFFSISIHAFYILLLVVGVVIQDYRHKLICGRRCGYSRPTMQLSSGRVLGFATKHAHRKQTEH